MVAYPDRSAGNDPEHFFFRGVCSLSQPRINIFTVGNMRVMICLGQGGLRSLSASSLLNAEARMKTEAKRLHGVVKSRTNLSRS